MKAILLCKTKDIDLSMFYKTVNVRIFFKKFAFDAGGSGICRLELRWVVLTIRSA